MRVDQEDRDAERRVLDMKIKLYNPLLRKETVP